MKCIVGLGNPGPEYALTKHNIGSRVVKEIAKELGIKIKQKLCSSLLGRGSIAGEDIILALPQGFMNLSGHAVGELYKKETKKIEDLVVVCDDINLKLGRIRIRKGGSSGGHKGLGSIINMLGRYDFTRLRVGIATDVHKGDITNYVLSPFKRKERKLVAHAINLAKDACFSLIEKGVEDTMAKFNTKKTGTS